MRELTNKQTRQSKVKVKRNNSNKNNHLAVCYYMIYASKQSKQKRQKGKKQSNK